MCARLLIASLIVSICCGCVAPAASIQPASPSPTPPPTLLPTGTLPSASGTPLPPTRTPRPATPVIETWSGLPVFVESQPGARFSLEFDSNRWGRVADTFGFPALAHRHLPSCQFGTLVGRGLPAGASATQSFRNLGGIRFEVIRVSEGGALRYVNYIGGDGVILAGFRVSFGEQVEPCIGEAETILSTLRSNPAVP